MVGVAARMKDLQRYLAPFPVHCLGHLAVFGYLPGKAQLGAVGHQPPPQIGGDTAGHDETDPATWEFDPSTWMLEIRKPTLMARQRYHFGVYADLSDIKELSPEKRRPQAASPMLRPR